MPNSRVLGLCVSRIVEKGDGKATIDGRICDADLKLGDVFRVAFRYQPHKDMQSDANLRQPIEERAVALRVISMEAYKRMWDELSAGMTGRFVVEGTGAELLRDDDVLGSEAVPG